MNQEQKEVSYDELMPLPFEERLKIFNEISAENRALLVKTQVERWLETHRLQLNQTQIALLDEAVQFITPDKYEEDRDTEKVEREIEKLQKKMETVFSRDEMRQILTNRADHIPPVDTEKN